MYNRIITDLSSIFITMESEGTAWISQVWVSEVSLHQVFSYLLSIVMLNVYYSS